MRVLHLTKSLDGGAGEYALRLDQGLRQLGIQSTVAAPRPCISNKVLLDNSNALQTKLHLAFAAILNRLCATAYATSFGWKNYCLAEDPVPGRIIHLHSMTGWIGLRRLGKIIPPGSRVVWTAHDLWLHSGGCIVFNGCTEFQSGCGNCPIFPFPISRVWPRLELANKRRFVKKRRVCLVANSLWSKRLIEKSGFHHFGCGEIMVVPPALHESFWEYRDRKEARRSQGISEEAFVVTVGCSSVTDQNKNLGPFVHGLSKHSLGGNILLQVFGDGPLEIAPTIAFKRHPRITDRSKLATILAASDVFASPSRMETFGMAIIEAQAVGTPVVAFNAGGISEAVIHGETGLLVVLDDFLAMFEAIELLRKEPELRRTMGERARKIVRDRNSLLGTASAYAHLYKELLRS